MHPWLVGSLFLASAISFSAGVGTQGLESLVRLLSGTDNEALQRDILLGITKGLEGRRRVEMPGAWPVASLQLQQSRDSEVRDLAIQLALVFDDPSAIRLLRDRAMNLKAPASDRMRAIELLVAKHDSEFDVLLLQLLDDPVVRRSALRGLAEYDHPQTVSTLLKSYSSFDTAAKQDALQTLASKLNWAEKLLDAVESHRIEPLDLSAYTARQLHSLGSDELTERLRQLWGEVRTTPSDKARLIDKYKQQLTAESLADADLSAGRQLFDRTCANCHKLFGEGKQLGPDITGSQRTNLDYILQNLIDPSGTVSRDYQMHIVFTTGGRIITGLIARESDQAITIQTVNEQIVLPVGEIEERSLSPVSMMPDGQLQKLSSAEVRDLIAYLGSRRQVPLPHLDD